MCSSDLEGLWQLMYAGSRFPGGMVLNAAISGIEHALWDIAGKAAGLPVYRLMGGKCRNKVRVYQSPHGNTPEELADNALKLIGTYGYTALKTFPFPPNWQAMPWPQALRQVDKRMAALRNAVGDAIEIGVDPHARLFEVSRAVELCEVLAPYRPMFVEEALRPENYEALQKLIQKVKVHLARGELLQTIRRTVGRPVMRMQRWLANRAAGVTLELGAKDLRRIRRRRTRNWYWQLDSWGRRARRAAASETPLPPIPPIPPVTPVAPVAPEGQPHAGTPG